MLTSLTRKALILSGGRGYKPAVVGAGTRHLPRPRTHAPCLQSAAVAAPADTTFL